MPKKGDHRCPKCHGTGTVPNEQGEQVTCGCIGMMRRQAELDAEAAAAETEAK